jgi:hypothetical protein
MPYKIVSMANHSQQKPDTAKKKAARINDPEIRKL